VQLNVRWKQLDIACAVEAILSMLGVFNVSSPSTREGSDGSSNAPRRWISDKSEKEKFVSLRKSEFVTRGPSKLPIAVNPLLTDKF